MTTSYEKSHLNFYLALALKKDGDSAAAAKILREGFAPPGYIYCASTPVASQVPSNCSV
jgi:hypothetical protein